MMKANGHAEDKENAEPPTENERLDGEDHTRHQHHSLNGFSFPSRDENAVLNTVNDADKTSPICNAQKIPASDMQGTGESHRTFKLSPQQIQDVTSSPGYLPVEAATPTEEIPILQAGISNRVDSSLASSRPSEPSSAVDTTTQNVASLPTIDETPKSTEPRMRTPRSTSSPTLLRRKSSHSQRSRPHIPPLKTEDQDPVADGELTARPSDIKHTSPIILPVPPLSLPTYLQLELSAFRPSPLYIQHDPSIDFPYESSQVKFERLLNFLRLPPQLEQVLWFGTLACLDSWLYTFTILPLRFLSATDIFFKWFVKNASKEVLDLSGFVYQGIGRVWRRRNIPSRRPSVADGDLSRRPSMGSRATSAVRPTTRSTLPGREKSKSGFRHRRTRSVPSTLLPIHKADILQGLLIIFSCIILMWLDASRMYHSIRGQAAIKLYVIYNVLEVFDRLFSALGQDVLECLFSKETLERDSYGRSKIFRPLWMFFLALAYNVIHATALFYQLVTLNVAVNSYSNALLTLLMSNQFVEIKGTVFKKFEKENLFQLTCADVVERFQLWLMLTIIAFRNIVEVGGLSIDFASSNASTPTNSTIPSTMIPNMFSLLPSWTGEVVTSFLIVLGSEMLVDWLKHAYITKFNNVKPNIYGRFLDVLAKDYYSHAFADQNLTKRLGLPVIPLSCLFIRASVQTYHMFLAQNVPPPISSIATAVSLESEAATTPATRKALQHFDHMFKQVLGRAAYGLNASDTNGWFTLDNLIAVAAMAIFFLALYLILLAFKLLLGMLLLSYSRSRYAGMKAREQQPTDAKGRRVGGWGMIEVGDEKRKWIYEDDKEGLKELQAKEAKSKSRAEKAELNLDNVDRYMMAAKRIW